jgi:hypothetical protein
MQKISVTVTVFPAGIENAPVIQNFGILDVKFIEAQTPDVLAVTITTKKIDAAGGPAIVNLDVAA